MVEESWSPAGCKIEVIDGISHFAFDVDEYRDYERIAVD
jgi:hypothetical protein